jgi:hypothetical protein
MDMAGKGKRVAWSWREQPNEWRMLVDRREGSKTRVNFVTSISLSRGCAQGRRVGNKDSPCGGMVRAESEVASTCKRHDAITSFSKIKLVLH